MIDLSNSKMALSVSSAPPVFNFANATDTNHTFDVSFWSQLNIERQYEPCRSEFALKYVNDTVLLLLQSQDNINYIARRCEQAIAMRHLTIIIPFCVGIPANIIALVALLTLRPHSIGLFYIALLAASDLAALVMKCVDYLLVDNAIDTNRLLCGLRNSLVHFFPCYANWVLVVISFERYYALRFPLSKAAHFTFKRAKLLVAVLAVLIFAFNLSRMHFAKESQGGYCGETDSSARRAIDEIYHVLVYYAPQTLVFVFLVLIAHGLYQAQQAREKMFTSNSLHGRPGAGDSNRDSAVTTESDSHQARMGSSGAILNDHTSRMLRQQRKNERSLTIMMFCAALCFLILTFPLLVVIHSKPDPMMGVAEMDFKFYLILAQGLNMLTHVVNFFLYCITGARMRAHLGKMLQLDKLWKLCGCVDYRRPSFADTEMTGVSRVPVDSQTNNDG